MANKLTEDPRIDPRIKTAMGAFEPPVAVGDVASREELLQEAASEEATAQRAMMTGFFEMFDSEDVVPSAGLTVSEHRVVSEPDGNTINIRFVRPEGAYALPCVYYIHGGGMQLLSCYDGNYRIALFARTAGA